MKKHTVVKKSSKKQRNNSDYLTISYRALSIFLITLVIGISAIMFIKGEMEEIKKKKDCREGFYFYENNDFSVCYPKNMDISTQEFLNVDGKNTLEVNFSDNIHAYKVIPRFQVSSVRSKCLEIKDERVDNLEIIRRISKHEIKNGCGEINNITTIKIDREKKTNVHLLFEQDKGEFNPEEYYIVDSSLVIK